ncbi:MAG: flagellar basal body rod protein FlgB [Micavibrio sp.]
MTTQNIGIFKALNAKMQYLDTRQKVLAQNVANADTPGYVPKDLSKVDFGRVLQDVTKDRNLRVETTNPMHMPPPNTIEDPKNRGAKLVYEVAPDGNEVSLEEQMVKSSQNTMDYNLMTTLYQKNVNIMRTAIGVGR